MKTSRFVCAVIAAFVLSLVAPMHLRAAGDDAQPDQKPTDIFASLKFRNLGPPSAGGRVAAVAGVPGNPSVYYVGAGGGGVFKTEDGGLTWTPIFEHEKTASIGAIAIAPSNPSLIWVGTGEGNIRNDVIDGAGVYFSSDAGHSWKFMGLGETQQITAIAIDPNDPNTVFVGALGHTWGPNPDRGVYRTTDGGKTWKKVLFVNDSTGVSDLTMAGNNPKVLFAAMWQFRRYPWTLMDGGADSGIYRSTDGGDTWEKLSKGLPEGPLGRIAVAVAPSNPQHVYALIGAKEGMLWQSLDLGDSWTSVTNNRAIDVRAFYFSKMEVAPDNENKIYFLSFNVMESDDGGRTAHAASRVHSDHHAIWIDPKNPDRIIEGGDGGVYLTTDGAKHWAFLDNLPIEQFYQVAADSKQPYDLCGGLQDNSAWCGPSSDLSRNGVMGSAWYTVVGGDGEYAVPAPSDPNIVYSDSQNGSIERVDMKTHVSRSIRPVPEGVEEVKPSDLKYRFNWTSPIAVSPTNADEVYIGANVLFKSTDGGRNWTAISGDLTRNDKAKQDISGYPVQHDISGAETYDTIMCITLAPSDPKVIWIGSDDGLVNVTRDGGKTWTNVTAHIAGAPEWARVYQIGVSPTDAGTAYLTYDAHMLDNRHVYVYRTSDYGATWQKITEGLPDDSPAHVVREDPNQKGFLVLGTDTGLFYSRDNGDHWQALKSNFPTVPVFDLKFVKSTHDLVVATHGRGIFVLDDIRPIEEMTPEIEKSAFHLFESAPGVDYHHWRSGEGGETGYTAPNAAEGVVLEYYLQSPLKPTPEQRRDREGPVKIVFSDEKGNVISTQYGPAEAGVNRYVWGGRYEGGVTLRSEAPRQGPEMQNANPGFGGRFRGGPAVPPGTYKVAVTVNGQTQTQTVTLLQDPNTHVDPAVFAAQTKMALRSRNETSAMNEMLNRINDIEKTLSDFSNMVQSSDDKDLKAKYQPIVAKGRDLSKKLNTVKDVFINPATQAGVSEDDIHFLARLQSQISRAGGEATGSYGEMPPTVGVQHAEELWGKLDEQLKAFNQMLKTDVPAYNKAAESAGAPTVFTGEPVEVKPVKGM